MGSLGSSPGGLLGREIPGTGAGVRIGLIDTGADSMHPDLAGKIAANYEAVMGYESNFVDRVEVGIDRNEHGTACAGILARIAPGAQIHSVQVIGQHPSDNPEKLIAGIRFAVDQGWEVLNISAGAGKPYPELRSLVRRAYAAGTILVAAKDNRPGHIGYPAAYPEVIAVDMEFFPDPLDWRYHPGAEIEVEASGIYIDAPLAGGGRHSYTGSSFAAPHVAAIAARLKERAPQLDTAGFRRFLQARA